MECENNKSCGAGKGDKPRSCFSQKYRDNYDAIKWKKSNDVNTPETKSEILPKK